MSDWKENPASEAQMKWVNDILDKARDKGIDNLNELEELYGDGVINGGTASEIISNWNDKVS
tara:strand:- start:619 stop:804 length:186 start_codon:yes stop_codon:yes gene_type:complete